MQLILNAIASNYNAGFISKFDLGNHRSLLMLYCYFRNKRSTKNPPSTKYTSFLWIISSILRPHGGGEYSENRPCKRPYPSRNAFYSGAFFPLACPKHLNMSFILGHFNLNQKPSKFLENSRVKVLDAYSYQTLVPKYN